MHTCLFHVQIDAVLQRIALGEAEALLAQVWRLHYGQWCRGVNWERCSLAQLQEIARWVDGCMHVPDECITC